ncbi:hypothetical protein Bca4012_059681 [Brassica carinata]|uniref:Uncharacterized protein n=1 Tax=Brassica carinata TaxID=52824 RepID=A0A8X7V2V3_BRACI|nr:hypothetical protein Bca52824_030061 [Brassica carinata]
MVNHGEGEGVRCNCGGRVRGVAKRRRWRLDDTEEETEMSSPFDSYKVLERGHGARCVIRCHVLGATTTTQRSHSLPEDVLKFKS